MAHFPIFRKLGPCQGLMHQTEIRIFSVGGGGARSWPGAPPMKPSPAGKSEQQGDLLCALPLPPHWKAPGGLSRAGGWARLGKGADWPAGALSARAGASDLPASSHSSIHASLSSRFSAEQTRMVSVAFPGPTGGGTVGGILEAWGFGCTV